MLHSFPSVQFNMLCSPVLWGTWLVWACKDISRWVFFKWNGGWKEIVINSLLVMCKGLCQHYNCHSIIVCIPLSSLQRKKIFLCTNPELLQCAINIDIIPWMDIFHTPKPSLKLQKSSFITEILLLPVRWLPRECSAAGIADLKRSQGWSDTEKIKQMEEKKTPAAIAWNVSRWVCWLHVECNGWKFLRLRKSNFSLYYHLSPLKGLHYTLLAEIVYRSTVMTAQGLINSYNLFDFLPEHLHNLSKDEESISSSSL